MYRFLEEVFIVVEVRLWSEFLLQGRFYEFLNDPALKLYELGFFIIMIKRYRLEWEACCRIML